LILETLPAAKSSATTQKTPKKSTPNAPRKSTTPKGIVNVPSSQCPKCLDKKRYQQCSASDCTKNRCMTCIGVSYGRNDAFFCSRTCQHKS
jgi:hypothetical protein